MKGFLKVFLIIIVLAILCVLGLCGTCCFLGNHFQNDLKQQFTEKNPVTLEQRAKSIIEYKPIKNYKLVTAFTLPIVNFKAALFNNVKSKQFMAISDPGWLINLNENNFKESLTPTKINEVLSQSQSNNVEITNFKIIEEGKISTQSSVIPFIYANLTVKDNVKGITKDFEGFMAVKSSNNKNVIMVSGNSPGKFNFNEIKEFVKNIR